jgi:hypothetical protein
MRQRGLGVVMEADMGKDLAFLEAIPGKFDFSGPVTPRRGGAATEGGGQFFPKIPGESHRYVSLEDVT